MSLSQDPQHKNLSTLYEYAPFLVLAGLKKDLRREGPALGLSGFLEESKQVKVEEVCCQSPLPSTPIRFQPSEILNSYANLAQGVAKAVEMKITTHVEVSVQSGDGVDELFHDIVKAAVEKEKAGLRKLRHARHEYQVDRGIEKAGETLKSFNPFGKK